MRQSIKSLKASENQSLNESMVIGALAEYYLNGTVKGSPALDQSIEAQSMQVRKAGEEAILEKINQIFDEQLEAREFQSSYQKTKAPMVEVS